LAPEPVDWGLAHRVARKVAGRDALADSYLAASLDRDFADVTVRAEAMVAELTGLRAPGTAHAAVLERTDWVAANVRSMRTLVAPLTDRVGERMAKSPFAPVGRAVTGTEMGFMLGYLARRVLGQYDLLVPEGPDGTPDTDAVYYVGANILDLEKRFAFRPRDFRLWIAIHEVTHRAQFTGVPWMRDYFLGLVQQTLTLAEPDPKRFVEVLRRAAEDVRRGRNPLDDGGIVGLVASPEQRVVLDRVQALMSLLEGHGNWVMNHLGAIHVEGQARMARVLNDRRARGGISGLLQKALGFEMKMRQYEVGERFILAVERAAGFRAIDAAWQSPESLPTLADFEDPEAWMQRVGLVVGSTGTGR
jgi:coenzyme F420 biosynthesis associated uncharacterized protein